MNDGEINVMIIILLRMSYNSSQLLKLNSPLPLRGRDESALDAIAAPLKSMILLGFSLGCVPAFCENPNRNQPAEPAHPMAMKLARQCALLPRRRLAWAFGRGFSSKPSLKSLSASEREFLEVRKRAYASTRATNGAP